MTGESQTRSLQAHSSDSAIGMIFFNSPGGSRGSSHGYPGPPKRRIGHFLAIGLNIPLYTATRYMLVSFQDLTEA